MDPPGFSATGASPRKELQGPRPPQLRLNKDSRTIKKPPRHQPPLPPPQPPPRNNQPPLPPPPPVIIFSISPKPIHTTVGDFPALVQRLTGHYSGEYSVSAEQSSGGDVSPAARLASIEGASPRAGERNRGNETEEEMTEDLMSLIEGFDMDLIRGILSPAPTSLPPIPQGFFSPPVVSDFPIFNDLSPFHHGGNLLMTSPSTLYSPPFDLSRLFDY